MQIYKLKRGFKPEIDRIREVMEMNFPDHVTQENEKLIASYGAIQKMEVWIDNKKLHLETESNPSATDEEIIETNKRFRKFLDEATGYSSKQRVKMAKKEAQD
ncbi:MAG: DUF5611 family protein [Methanosarcinales archaeon]|nr:DUF5611 family protein [Methanosarcinales archaeon]